MLSRPLPFRGRALLGLAALPLSLFIAPALPAEAPKSEQTLTLGEETPEQPIKAGESHPWRIAVPPGTSVLVTIDQRSISLVAEVREPGNQKPILFGAGNDRWGPVVLLLENTGDYKIEVRPREKSPWPGRYTMRAEAVPSTEARHESLALMSQAGREAALGTPEFRRRAIATYRKALAKWKDLGERAWEAEALTCIAMLEEDSSDLPQSTQDFEAVLKLWQELRRDQRQAEALNRLGILYLDAKEAGKPHEAWENALSLWRGLGERYDEAQTRSNLCSLDRQTGKLAEALACYQESLEFFRGRDAAQEAEILNSLGGVYDLRGEPDAALASYQQALTHWQTLGDRDREATLLNNIGIIHRALGEWQEALRSYNSSLEILGSLDDRALAATVLNNIGFVYNVLGDPQRALGYLDNALKLYRKLGIRSKEILCLNNLGISWRKLGDWKRAMGQHRKALEIATSLGNVPQQATSRLRLAEVYLERGDPSAALPELDAALRLLGEKGDRRNQIQALHLRGQALMAADRAREALPILQQVLTARQELRDRAGEAETLDAMALAERSLGLTTDSLTHAGMAVGLIEELRSSFLSAEDLRASFLATRRRSFSLLIDLLMARHGAEPEKGYDREAFKVSERARARSLLDVLRAGSPGQAASTSPSELLTQRRALLRRLSAKVNQRWQASGTNKETLEKEINATLDEVNAVEADIRRNDPRFAAFSAPQPVAPEEISRGLEAGTVLLEYSLGEDRSFLWAIEPGRVRSFPLSSQAEIERLARQAYQELSTVESGRSHSGKAVETLSRILLGPFLDSHAGGKAAPLQRIVVVPDGALALVPFAALPVPEPGRSWKSPGLLRPLLERVEVVSIPSATTLGVLREQRQSKVTPTSRWAVVFGDPVFTADDPRVTRRSSVGGRSLPGKGTPAVKSARRFRDGRALSLPLQRLTATRREAEAIRDLAPPGKVKLELGLEATREAVLARDLHDFRILHFATHAMADTQNPELSGLFLSQVDAEGRPREGFLALSDVYDLNLDADLVVLSGCRTALGKEVRGEGLLGLTRAFQYSGVPRVVASLWPVEDRATAELMKRFYKAMWGNHHLAPAAALREAQKSLSQDPLYRDTHSWAAFVFQGDWR